MSSLRKLLLHFSHFFGGSAMIMLLGLVTFPILTRLLSREDYGILGLVTTTVSMAVAVAKGGLSDGIIRFYRDYSGTPERQSEFTSTVLIRGVTLATVVAVLYVLVFPHINRFLGIKDRYIACFLVMALYLFVRPLNIIVLNYLRALGKTAFYNLVNIGTRSLSVLLALGLLLYVIHDLYGYFIGVVIAEFAGGVVLFRWLLTNYRFSFRRVSAGLTLNLLKFGLPLLLTEMSYLLLTYVDRYMIVAYRGEDTLGLYSVGYNLPSYLNELIMFSLSYAVVPIYTDLYAREGRAKTEEFLGRALYYYLMLVIPLCVGYYAVSRELLVVLASHKYAEAAVFSPIVLVGLVFLGMNTILYAGLYLEKKSTHILGIMLTALVVNVAMNMVLLPAYGAAGAAVATLVACIVSTVLTVRYGFRYLRIRVDFPALLYYLLSSAAMGAIVLQIDTARDWATLAARTAAGAAIMALAVLWRERAIRTQVRALLPFR